MPTCVIYNPAAGRGKADQLLRECQHRWRQQVLLRPSEYPGHATDLACQAAEEGFERIVAAGGDGTVHEVANGLLRANKPQAVFSIWPIGSANDYAYTLGLLEWWKQREKPLPTQVLHVDVGRITGGGRERFYVNSLGIGFNGMVTIESRKIRRLRGLALYILAFLRALRKHYETPITTVRFDDTLITAPTLAITLNLAQREGGFPLTPHASLTDGRFDYLHALGMPRWRLLRYLPAMAFGCLPSNHPLLKVGQCSRMEVQAPHPLCIHADGEFFCRPEDNVHAVQVELLPARLAVEIFPPALYGAWGKPTADGNKT